VRSVTYSLLAGDWGMYEELASECVSSVNLSATK
jgi:hypothetical protein